MKIVDSVLVQFDEEDFTSEELIIPDEVTEIKTIMEWSGKRNKIVKVLNLNNVRDLFITGTVIKNGKPKPFTGLSPLFSGITMIIAPELESMSSYFFSNRASLTTLVAPKVKRIGNYAFTGCSNLKDVEICSAELIEKEAFSRTAVETIEFSDNIKDIGSHAFAHTQLVEVDVKGAKCNGGAFAGCNKLNTLKISKLSAVASTAINYCESFKTLEVGDKISRAKVFPFVSNNFTYNIKSEDEEIKVIGNGYDCKSYNIIQKIAIDSEYAVCIVKGGYLVWSHSRDSFISYEKESLDKVMQIIEYEKRRK